MDIFMDKLAQRLTAQEIIKANTEADTEELNQLKNQLALYNNCLDRLQKLISEGEAKLSGARRTTGDADVRSLVEESIRKIRALQQDTDGMERLQRQLTEQLDKMDRTMVDQLCNMDKAVADQLAGIDKSVESRIGGLSRTVEERFGGIDKTMERQLVDMDKVMKEQLADMDRAMKEHLAAAGQAVDGKLADIDKTMEERLNTIDQTMSGRLEGMDQTVAERLDMITQSIGQQTKDNPAKQVTESLEAMGENMHKECVKVYRNVQAVIVEESGKQNSAVNEAVTTLKGMKGRMGALMGLAVAALTFSLACVAMQVLSMLKVL